MEYEHRIRLWWSIYILDRFWGSKSGFPVQIHDDDIHVNLPSSLASEIHHEQFPEVAYQIASIGLAKITGCMMKEIYTRKKSSESFLKREQRILISLQQWVHSLPECVRIHTDKANSKHTVLMHLQFNYVCGTIESQIFHHSNILQCVILAIRPVLLGFLSRQRNDQSVPMDQESKHISITLSEACINAARYSLRLCLDEWTNGSLVIFGYAFPAFLFSSGLVLAIASILTTGNKSDLMAFETAMEMLKVLSNSENLAAKDLYENFLQVKQCISDREFLETAFGHENGGGNRDVSQTHGEFLSFQESRAVETPVFENSLDPISLVSSPPLDFQQCDFTTETVLQSSMMREFLSRAPADMGLLDIPEIPNEFDAAFLWLDDNTCIN